MSDIDFNNFHLDNETDFSILSEDEPDEEGEPVAILDDLMRLSDSPPEKSALLLEDILQSNKELKRRRH